MQHAGIAAGGDDGSIGRRFRAMAAEFVQQFGFDFVFGQAGARCAHGPRVRARRNLRRAAHGRDFALVLEQAHFVQHGEQVVELGRRADAGTLAPAHGIEPGLHLRLQLGVASNAVEQRRHVGQQFGQFRIERSDRIGGIEAERGARAFRSVAEAIPDFTFLVFFAAEQDRACVR